VRENVDTYWRGVRDEIVGALERSPDRREFSSGTVEWCVLGVARMWFTATTGSVASKRAAGEWAGERMPSCDVFDLAVRIRAGNGPAAVDRATVVAMIAAMDTMIAAMV
jgi:hypothetical protein